MPILVVKRAKASFIEWGHRENEYRLKRRIRRQASKEVYYTHTGKQDFASFYTLLYSRSQRKLVLLGAAWYCLQMLVYMVLANFLTYLTLHALPPESPSYPGPVAVNGSNPFFHRALSDTGFMLTPDLSYRPFWLKAVFVDMMVTIAQLFPPIMLTLTGQTYNFICYTGLIGVQNLMKGFLQIGTILPAARHGETCWELNFGADELHAMRTEPLATWLFKPWGMTHGCNDMLWSGHTSQSCIGLLFIDKTLRHWNVPKCLRGLLIVYFAIYVWSVLALRMHYTIDVLVATLIGVALYTHTPLRFWLWWFANHLCCNEEFASDDTDDEDSDVTDFSDSPDAESECHH